MTSGPLAGMSYAGFKPARVCSRVVSLSVAPRLVFRVGRSCPDVLWGRSGRFRIERGNPWVTLACAVHTNIVGQGFELTGKQAIG